MNASFILTSLDTIVFICKYYHKKEMNTRKAVLGNTKKHMHPPLTPPCRRWRLRGGIGFKNLECEDTPGKNMRFYRKLAGMTQSVLAEKLCATKQFVYDMENGRKPISKATAKKLAKIFDVSVARFI